MNKISNKKFTELLNYLYPFLNDSNPAIRRFCISEVSYMLQMYDLKESYPMAIRFFLQAVNDKEGGISALAMNELTQFSVSDFSEAQKDTLCKLLGRITHHRDRLIKLAGFLNLNHCDSILRAAAADKHNLQVMWAARLALARMGDEYEIEYCLAVARKYGINDETIYSLVPDLLYVRQKAVFDYLIQEINKNEKNCFPADAGRHEPVNCAYRLMESIAPYVIGFPLEVDRSGDIISTDYNLALQITRKWLNENRQSLQLNTTIY